MNSKNLSTTPSFLNRVKLFLPVALCLNFLSGCTTSNWRTASRESAGIAPKPEDLKESIFQVYAARAFSWRGYFATHPWVAWKRKADAQYTVAQVYSWGHEVRGSTINVEQDVPDRHWFSNPPEILFTVQGDEADRIIAHVEKLIENYPHKNRYVIWPGPNSNTFVDYIVRNTPGITVELPPHAIGKDYLPNGGLFAKSPTGTGIQMSVLGILGFTVGLGEGIEVNLLGLNFGFDLLRPALKLPFVGRVGMRDKPF